MTVTAYKFDIFNFQTGEFDQSVSLYRTYSIGYVLSPRSGSYIVTFVNPSLPQTTKGARQEISVLPRAFLRIMPEVKADVIAGCIEATPDKLRELGFIFGGATL